MSELDLTLSEGFVRLLSNAMNVTPGDTPAMQALEAKATPAQTAAATTKAQQDKLWLQLAIQHLTGPLTGAVARDVEVVEKLATTAWDDVGKPHDPSTFPA
ncbi:MAG TPA: hypothetical protein VGM88_16710 [Kofleriaceae bacterium]